MLRENYDAKLDSRACGGGDPGQVPSEVMRRRARADADVAEEDFVGRTAPAERFRQALGGEIASLLEVDADAREAGRGGKPWYDGTWRDERGASKERPYRLMKDCLLRQNRDILYSFCQYGMGHAEEWARDAGANCWRCWDDLKDTWPWMEKALEARIGAENYWKFAGPGCWVDPDMMIVGDQRSFGSTHPTYLTPNEQYTHVSLWCMIGSPLLIGCDLTKLDAFTKS